jgi:hypothetical protein
LRTYRDEQDLPPSAGPDRLGNGIRTGQICRVPEGGESRSAGEVANGGTDADTIDVQEAPLMDGIDSVIGSDMADTVFMDPDDLLSDLRQKSVLSVFWLAHRTKATMRIR